MAEIDDIFRKVNGVSPLPKSQGEGEFHIGYRGHDIPIPAETMRVVFAHPPGKPEPVVFIYFQDANKDVGRLEFPREVFERLFHEAHDLLAQNRPVHPSL